MIEFFDEMKANSSRERNACLSRQQWARRTKSGEEGRLGNEFVLRAPSTKRLTEEQQDPQTKYASCVCMAKYISVTSNKVSSKFLCFPVKLSYCAWATCRGTSSVIQLLWPFRRCDWLFPPSAREVSSGNLSNYKSTRERVHSKGLYGGWRLHLMGSCYGPFFLAFFWRESFTTEQNRRKSKGRK